jgi:flagellar motor switch/type III secretory pathway protein FliN
MNRLPRLRNMTEADRMRRSTIAILQGKAIRAYLKSPDRRARYLRFTCKMGADVCHGLIDVHVWASHTFPTLSGLAWPAATDDYLLSLFNGSEQALHGESPQLAMEQFSGIEVLTGERYRSELVCLPVEEGEIFIEALPTALLTGGGTPSWFAELPMRLTFHLGQSPISPRLLRSVKIGDVILIDCPTYVGMVQNQACYKFILHEDTVMIQDSTPSTLYEANSVIGAKAGHEAFSPKISRIKLDFILQEIQCPLHILLNIQPGEVIKLDEGAELNVQIRINGGTLVGTGELVEFDHQLGVEIKSIRL